MLKEVKIVKTRYLAQTFMANRMMKISTFITNEDQSMLF